MQEIKKELGKYKLSTVGDKATLWNRLQEHLNTDSPKAFSKHDADNWTIKQLREELERLNLPKNGNKEELSNRLASYWRKELKVGPNKIDFKNWTVKELRIKCKEYGLKQAGSKKDLCDRIDEYLNSDKNDTSNKNEVTNDSDLQDQSIMKQIGFTKVSKGSEVSEKENYIKLEIPEDFFKKMHQKPIEYSSDGKKYSSRQVEKCDGNAYLFGPIFSLNEYKSLGMFQDQVGFLDLDQEKYIWKGDLLNKEYTLYIHQDDDQTIDSLIVENSCLFN